MDFEIDFQAAWSWVTSVDWLWAGIVLLLALNVLLGSYFAWVVLTGPSFFEKYNLSRSAPIVRQAQNLEDVPSMDQIKVETPSRDTPVPQKYTNLESNNLFMPADARSEVGPERESGENGFRKELPAIKGYEIVGRVSAQRGDDKSMIRRKNDGKTFVASEGEYIGNSDIKVTTVTDTLVKLSQPKHRTTTLQFKSDQIEERMRKYIHLQ